MISGPNAYQDAQKSRSQKIIDLDCRGLEFTDFKADVSYLLCISCIYGYVRCVNMYRANGKPKEQSLRRHSQPLISPRGNGTTMMRRPETKYRLKRSNGRLSRHKSEHCGVRSMGKVKVFILYSTLHLWSWPCTVENRASFMPNYISALCSRPSKTIRHLSKAVCDPLP